MQQTYQCPNCSNSVMSGARFCGTCGIHLNWTTQQQMQSPPHNEPLTSEKIPTIERQSFDINKSESQELLLLLLRPSLSKIFVIPSDNPPIDADGISTNYGMHNTKGINKHALERLPTLCVSENGSVGYTIPMRLDLQLCLQQLASDANPPIDFPLGLFTNRDVIVISKGLYTVQLWHNTPKGAIKALNTKLNEFLASKIIYACTTIDEGAMTNLRRLEATAQHLLASISPKTTTPPKLSAEIASGWQHDFLGPIFKRAKEVIK